MLDIEQQPLRIIWKSSPNTDALGLLGGFRFGERSVESSLPFAWLDMPILGSSDPCGEEIWCSSRHISYGQKGNIRFGQADSLIFGVISLDESDPCSLDKLTTEGYSEILGFLNASGFHEIWRLWNHFSDINSDSSGLERYRQFNIGRQVAFDRAEGLMKGCMPAASAVGVRSGPLTIAFLAGKSPPTLIENPAQVSAYEYPEMYGPQSPSFSRGAIANLGPFNLVLVSGTASIKGHETVNLGDPYEQTLTALHNIQIVIETAERQCGIHIDLSHMYYRVYVRNAEDLLVVQRAVTHYFGQSVQVHYVQADICRRDLLVEIEATGYAD